MLKVKVQIRGDNWAVYFLDEDEFQSRAECYDDYAGAAGLTKPASRRIMLDMGSFNLALVKHEVFRAFYSTLLMDSADLSEGQIEEMVAELHAHYAKQMTKVSNCLYRIGRCYAKKCKRA